MDRLAVKKINVYFSSLVLLLIIVSGLLAPIIVPYNPFQPDMANRLELPGMLHWLGTDALGRDMLSRLIMGSRNTIVFSLICTLISLALGSLIGLVAGFYGGRFDKIYNIVCSIFQGIPGTCFMIAIAGFWGPGVGGLILAVVVSSWAGFSRVVRAEVIRLSKADYIEGLICLGASNRRIIFKHILPNIKTMLLILGTQRLGRAILAISALSFLGLGVQPPAPDWSVMISDSMLYYRSAPHLIIVPGTAIFLLVASINVIGDYLEYRLGIHNNEIRLE